MKFPFAQIDAFSDRPFSGNPAAVIPLDAWLDDATLLAIAAENNLSETAFLISSRKEHADFDLRWFTPTAEVALCGHATMASGHYILSNEWDRDDVRFSTRQAGMLEVARDDDGYRMALPALAPEPRPLPRITQALGVEGVVETLWHDKGYALVVVEREATVRAAKPDQRALAGEGDLVVIISARGEQTDIVSRVFVPAYGIDEDPVTGAAHAVMTPYWSTRLGREDLTAYQASARGGQLTCQLNGDRVLLGGRCFTVIEGSFLLR